MILYKRGGDGDTELKVIAAHKPGNLKVGIATNHPTIEATGLRSERKKGLPKLEGVPYNARFMYPNITNDDLNNEAISTGIASAGQAGAIASQFPLLNVNSPAFGLPLLMNTLGLKRLSYILEDNGVLNRKAKKQKGGILLNEGKSYPKVLSSGLEFYPDSTFKNRIEFIPGSRGTEPIRYSETDHYVSPTPGKSVIAYDPAANDEFTINLDAVTHGLQGTDSAYAALENNFKKAVMSSKFGDEIRHRSKGYPDGEETYIENETDGIIRNLLFADDAKRFYGRPLDSSDYKKYNYWDEWYRYLRDKNIRNAYDSLHSYLIKRNGGTLNAVKSNQLEHLSYINKHIGHDTI